MLNRMPHGLAVMVCQESHGRVAPFLDPFAKQQRRKQRRYEHRKNQRPEESKCHGPGHRPEKPPLDSLQRKNRQISRDDDGDGVKDRPLHFMGGFAHNVHRVSRRIFRMGHMPDDVLNHHYCAIYNHSKIQRAQREQVCRNAFQVEAGGGEQQRKWNSKSDNDGGADIPDKQKENDHNQNDAFGEVVQNGMRREVYQITAVDERNDFHAGWQNAVVQFLRLGMDSRERVIRIRAFAQEHDTRDHVVVVDDFPVFAMNRASKLAESNFRALGHDGNILDSERRAILGSEDGVFDITDGSDQSNFADIDLLLAGFDETAARIYIVVGELLLHLGDAETVGNQLRGIQANLILARGSAEAGHIYNIGDRFEIFLDDPIFDGF